MKTLTKQLGMIRQRCVIVSVWNAAKARVLLALLLLPWLFTTSPELSSVIWGAWVGLMLTLILEISARKSTLVGYLAGMSIFGMTVIIAGHAGLNQEESLLADLFWGTFVLMSVGLQLLAPLSKPVDKMSFNEYVEFALSAPARPSKPAKQINMKVPFEDY